VILPASQRLSVSVDDGGGGRRDDRECAHPSLGIAGWRGIAGRQNSQQAALQRRRNRLGVGAERQHGGDGGQHRKAGNPEQDAADRIPFHGGRGRLGAIAGFGVGDRPSEQSEMAEPPGGQRDGDDKGDAVGQAEHQPEARGCRDAADRCRERSPSKRCHHQRQRGQIEQQQRDQRARDDRGEHQRRRSAGRNPNECNHDHQLSRPLERLEVVLTPTIGDRTTRKPYEDFSPRR